MKVFLNKKVHKIKKTLKTFKRVTGIHFKTFYVYAQRFFFLSKFNCNFQVIMLTKAAWMARKRHPLAQLALKPYRSVKKYRRLAAAQISRFRSPPFCE